MFLLCPEVRILMYINLCLICCRGKYGAIAFPGDRFQEEHDFFKDNPMLSPIPSGRLIQVNPSRPFELIDRVRYWFGSGASVPYICRKYQHSILNPFWRGNVGVIKDLGVVAFKIILSDPYNLWEHHRGLGYVHWNSYWKETATDIYGALAMRMAPVELDGYSKDLDDVNDADHEEYVFHHPMHLTDIRYGDMAFEVYRLLVKESPALATPTASAPYGRLSPILEKIGNEHPNVYVESASHGLVQQWYPRFLVKKINNLPSGLATLPKSSQAVVNYLGLTPFQIGLLIVEIARHGSIHSVETEVINLVKSVIGNLNPPFTRTEVLKMLRQFLPNHLRIAYLGFLDESEWSLLQTSIRYPMDTIYKGPVFCGKKDYVIVKF